MQYIFIGSSRSIPIIKSIQIHVNEFKHHDVIMVQHKQIPFILIHRSPEQITGLKNKYQDQASNGLRSLREEYFIALAIGTDYGCLISKYQNDSLKETCSQAVYDYTGRAQSQRIKPLIVPPMTYNENTQFFNLTMK